MIKKLWQKYTGLSVQKRAAFWFLICSFLQRGISTVTTPIFTRLLTTEEYGQFTTYYSWLSIVTIFVSLRLYYGVYTQGLIKFSDSRKEYSSSLQGLSFMLSLVWTIIYLVFRDFWNGLLGLTTVQMLSMMVMIWATGVFQFWAGEQRVEYKYVKLVAVTLAVSLAKPIVGVIFVINAQDKATARILGLALVELIGYSGFFFVQMKRGKVFFSAKFWKHALMFNIPLIPHYLSQSVLSSSDRIMIKEMVGSSEAGIYGLAYSISQIMILFNTALMQTLSPWIYQKIKDMETKDIAPIGYMTLIGIALVNLALIVLAPEVVAVFAPEEYYSAIWVIPPVAMSVYFMYCYDLFAKFAFYYEKTLFIMLSSVFGAVLNLGLNYVCINAFGYVAAGYTTLVCYLVYSLCHYYFMRKICQKYCDGKQPYNTKILLCITGAFLICGFLMLFTYNYPVIRYGLIIIALGIAVWKREILISSIKRIRSLKKSAE